MKRSGMTGQERPYTMNIVLIEHIAAKEVNIILIFFYYNLEERSSDRSSVSLQARDLGPMISVAIPLHQDDVHLLRLVHLFLEAGVAPAEASASTRSEHRASDLWAGATYPRRGVIIIPGGYRLESLPFSV